VSQFAVIGISGRQLKVQEGDRFVTDRLSKKVGDEVTIKDVLFVKDAKKTSIGTPTVKGASVVCKILSHDKGKKVLSFKFKRRKSYSRRVGHRQAESTLQVSKIQSA